MRLFLSVFLLLASGPGPASDGSAASFAVNYDIVLTVDGVQHQVRSRARIANGSTLAVPMSRFRVDIDFGEVSGDSFVARVSVLERDGSDWLRLLPEPAHVSGQLNAPVSFVLSTATVHLDLAVAVAELR